MKRLLFVCLFAAAAYAQQAVIPLTIGKVTVQGSLRTRLEAWDWFPSTNENAYGLSGNILRQLEMHRTHARRFG